ncbi:MAG: hypothetical protein QME90_16955 [Thermodesulfobacteriota bacterium]|nr:hypothetical protein [Thermodesulfobacteriota bacterium]
MKSFRLLLVLFLCSIVISCAKAGTYSLSLRYQPVKEFPSLQQKVGSTLGVVPFKDERPDTLYIGRHTSLQGISSYFKSDPSPLEKAVMESLSQVLSRYGIKTVSISNWDGKPESLKNFETDSILTTEIRKFWTEGKAATFRTNAKTSIHFVIHLGVKKEGKVFTRNVEVEKEITVGRMTPERMEEMVNQILTDIFDSFFSNPYSQ